MKLYGIGVGLLIFLSSINLYSHEELEDPLAQLEVTEDVDREPTLDELIAFLCQNFDSITQAGMVNFSFSVERALQEYDQDKWAQIIRGAINCLAECAQNSANSGEIVLDVLYKMLKDVLSPISSTDGIFSKFSISFEEAKDMEGRYQEE